PVEEGLIVQDLLFHVVVGALDHRGEQVAVQAMKLQPGGDRVEGEVAQDPDANREAICPWLLLPVCDRLDHLCKGQRFRCVGGSHAFTPPGRWRVAAVGGWTADASS